MGVCIQWICVYGEDGVHWGLSLCPFGPSFRSRPSLPRRLVLLYLYVSLCYPYPCNIHPNVHFNPFYKCHMHILVLLPMFNCSSLVSRGGETKPSKTFSCCFLAVVISTHWRTVTQSSEYEEHLFFLEKDALSEYAFAVFGEMVKSFVNRYSLFAWK